MARLDLLEVVRDRVSAVVGCPVCTTLADGRRMPEAVTLSFGIPEEATSYYSMERTERTRVTAIARRVVESDAMADAHEAFVAIGRGGLDSRNGSYRFIGVEAQQPRPVPWDESGRQIWVFDAVIEIERTD